MCFENEKCCQLNHSKLLIIRHPNFKDTKYSKTCSSLDSMKYDISTIQLMKHLLSAQKNKKNKNDNYFAERSFWSMFTGIL